MSVQPSTVTLGDLLTLSLEVRTPKGVIAEPPDLGRELGTFEVRQASALPVQFEGETQTARFVAELQNFATGPQVLPAISVTVRDPMNRPLTLRTSEQTVWVQEVPPGPKDKGDIRGIKGVIGPVARSPWLWGLLALAAAAGFWFWRRRRQAIQGPPPPPPVPPDEEALTRLRELAARDWLAAGQVKEFYSALSDILRVYLEHAFQVPALERTTSELLRDLRRRSLFNAEQELALRELLEDGDLVKFAKFRPDSAAGTTALTRATAFVQATRAPRATEEKA